MHEEPFHLGKRAIIRGKKNDVAPERRCTPATKPKACNRSPERIEKRPAMAAPLTLQGMADKAALLLGIDPSLSLAQKVAQANDIAGLKPYGNPSSSNRSTMLKEAHQNSGNNHAGAWHSARPQHGKLD